MQLTGPEVYERDLHLSRGLRVAHRSNKSFHYSLQFCHHNHQFVMMQIHINLIKVSEGTGKTLPGNVVLMSTCGIPIK